MNLAMVVGSVLARGMLVSLRTCGENEYLSETMATFGDPYCCPNYNISAFYRYGTPGRLPEILAPNVLEPNVCKRSNSGFGRALSDKMKCLCKTGTGQNNVF